MAPFHFLSRLIDDEDPVIIMPYGGYINDRTIHAQARVLEDEGIVHEEEDGFVKNLYNSYKRLESDEISNAQVKVTMGQFSKVLVSDSEGYVYLNAEHGHDLKPNDSTEWMPLTYELIVNESVIYTITDWVMRPSKKASFGIISDMDDTVIATGISSTLKYKVIINSFFKHSSKRQPLKGAQEFYKLLHGGERGLYDNPFFYLSNSPWNLHEYLTEFLKFHDFPRGTLLLRDIGLEHKRKIRFQEGNKYVKISHILNTYPNLPFVLIGDAADIDHDIYIEIARQFPKRIHAIYIRTVRDKKKMALVKKLIESTTDVNVILIEDSKKAISHARQNELIDLS